MKYQIQSVEWLSSEEVLIRLQKNAKKYSEYADSTLLFVFRGSKSEEYEFYKVRFGRNNFMHLAGIKSKTKKAVEFYEACLNGTVKKEDCTPRHSNNNMYAKVAIMERLLDFRQSKCYKIGEKDLVTKDNDFEMATGNNYGIIGYDVRVSNKGNKTVNASKSAIPTTLLNNPLASYCSRPQKIMFILQKIDGEDRYHKIIFEIKKGLLKTEKKVFPENILNQLSEEILQQDM